MEAYGIPDSIDLDNGRAFASKKISGGAKTRYRNKVNPDDPDGLLVTLGIKPKFVLPYSGQSKPIERAWRDLAENISRILSVRVPIPAPIRRQSPKTI